MPRLVWPRVLVVLILAACATDPLPTASVDASSGADAPAVITELAGPPLTQLAVPTYDRSGEATHPDVVRIPGGWHGAEYWMAFTPYPGGREQYENPSIIASDNAIDWRVPAGLVNPVFRRPMERDAYNSDPDLMYDRTSDQLLMLYRQVRRGYNQIRASWSGDGVKWSRPRLVFLRPNHGIISPTLAVGPDGAPRVWYVDAGREPCRRRTTRVMMQRGDLAALRSSDPGQGWSAPEETGLVQPGYWIWHIDVIWVPEKREYWAVYPAYRQGQCGARDLFFATSPDGVTWRSFPAPLLEHGTERWTRSTLYRASLLYDRATDVVRVFLSGADHGPKWKLGYAEFPYAGLIARLEIPVSLPAADTTHGKGPTEDR